MADAQTTLDLTRRLARVARTVKMYGGDHPQARTDHENFRKSLEKVLLAEPKINFVLQGNAILVQELPQPWKDQSAAFLVEAMRIHGCSSLSFLAGVSSAELEKAVQLLAAKPQDVMDGPNLRESALQGLDRVRVNDIKYVAVTGNETVAHVDQVVNATVDTAKVASAVDDLSRHADTRRRLFGGAPSAASAASLDELLPRVQELARDGHLPEAKQLVVDFISRTLVPGASPLGAQITEALARIPDGLRNQVASTTVRAEVGGAVIARQISAGSAPEDLQKTFQEFAPGVGDAMVLLDAIARALRAAGQGASMEALERAMKFLPKMDQVEALLSGNVLVVNGDGETRSTWKQALSDAGYMVEVAGTAKDATDLLLQRANFDCVLMDMNLPDRAGGTILSKLVRAKMIVPIVIASRKAQTYQFDFEIFSYPKKKFLAVLEPAAILEAVKELATKREAQVDEAEKAEKTRAREIQEKLLPKEYPPTAGFELAHVYQPAGDVGGDYLDVFPIDADRVGFVVGDVSGKGYSAAMVMVMVRSAFRMASPGISSARDAVVRVNRLVTPDIKKGMFITIVYGCLHVPTGKLTLVNCAHNPPFHFDARRGSVAMLQPSGVPIGLASIERFESSIKEEEVTLHPGDHLVFYTDGVVEAMNARKDELGERPAMDAVQSTAAKGARAVADAVNASVTAHRGPAAQSDDITVLDVSRAPEPAADPEMEAQDVEVEAPRTLLDE